MSSEHQTEPAPRRPYEVFGFTEEERLRWRVNQDRFKEILSYEQTKIHTIEESSNNFGEFLFVTVSRVGERVRIYMTFYGYGFHEYRERWLTNEWFWYQTNQSPELLRQRITKDEASEILQERWDSIRPHVRLDTQTDWGRIFELLADLTDEDGALAEMEDLDNVTDLLSYFDGSGKG